MTTIIDKGVPITISSRRKKRPNKYPWRDMEPGDSFLFAEGTSYNSAYVQCRQASQTHKPKKFDFGQDENGRYRCWRVE